MHLRFDNGTLQNVDDRSWKSYRMRVAKKLPIKIERMARECVLVDWNADDAVVAAAVGGAVVGQAGRLLQAYL